MKINFIESTFPKEGSLVVFGYEEKQLSEFAKQVDKKTDGQISRAMEHDRYEGKFGQTLCLSARMRQGPQRQ